MSEQRSACCAYVVARLQELEAANRRLSDQVSRLGGTGLMSSVATLGLSVRAENVIYALGVELVGELICKSASDVVRVKNCGRKTLAEIRSALATLGLHLAGEKP